MHPYVAKRKTIETRSLDEEATAEFWRYGARTALMEKIAATQNNSKLMGVSFV